MTGIEFAMVMGGIVALILTHTAACLLGARNMSHADLSVIAKLSSAPVALERTR